MNLEREFKVGDLWRSRGMWEHEKEAVVRIDEILPSGNVDVNYELDQTKPADSRILPATCLFERVEP